MERKKERVGRKKAKVWGVGEVTNDEAGGRIRKDEVWGNWWDKEKKVYLKLQ